MNCFKAIAVCSIALLFGLNLKAYEKIPYYGDEFYSRPDLKDQELVQLLNKILKSMHQPSMKGMDQIVDQCSPGGKCFGHLSIGYNEAKKFVLSNYYIAQAPDGSYFMKDVYCEQSYRSNAPGPSGGAAGINTEHTWPQSHFTRRYSTEMQKSDLHHLFPTDSELNSARGNYPFGIVDKDLRPLKCKTSRYGLEKNSNQVVFEPPPSHRGNIARALFYFAVRYELKIGAVEETHLREWNKMDPVDPQEQDRNNQIFKLQGNRNPFIDMPELADRISDF